MDDLLNDRSYFFDEGLQFSCTRCGHCCTGEPGHVYLTQTELVHIAIYLNMDAEEFLETHCYRYQDAYSLQEHPDGRCIFFDEGCAIYDVRPAQCRTYPFWMRNVRSPERWAEEALSCPGMNRGRRFSKSEILDLIQHAPL